MAQSGYTPIKLYYSATTTNVPLAANLAAGELAINTADGKLFYKDSSNVVQVIASKAAANGVLTFSGGTTGLTPSTATSGAVTLAGTLAIANGGTGTSSTQFVNAASNVTGTLPVANGGTGTTTSTGTGSVVLSSGPTLTGSTTVQGLTLGLGGGAVSTNTAFGFAALNSNASGTSNTIIGYSAGVQITTGSNNTAVGNQAVAVSTTTSGNTGVGYVALTNTTGANNTAIGYAAGSSITSGSNNVVVGSYTGGAGPISATGSNWVVLSDGSGVVRQAIDSSGNAQFFNAVVVYQPTPASVSTTATLNNANLQTRIITATGTTYTVNMPTGTTLNTLVTWADVDLGYDFSLINTASGTVGLASNTGVTTVGSMLVATGTSAHFRIRRTAASTYILYRLS